MRFGTYITVLLVILGACTTKSERKHSSKMTIVATTGMIGDAVKNLCGDSAEVITLMGPGVDPHLYKPTLRDIDKLAAADIIVYNGLHLEGKMADMLHKIGKKKKVIAVSDGIPYSDLLVTNPDQVKEGGQPVYDPHIWFDVKLWSKGIQYAAREIGRYDSIHKAQYDFSGKAYWKTLEGLDFWAKDQIKTIPKESRLIITAHDAFNYFGRAYEIEVMGLQGISTVSEPGLKDISQLVELLVTRKIKAVFVESSVSHRSINAVIEGCKQRGHHVKIGGTLFSDAMGAEGTREGTYKGMVEHNVRTIVEGLR